MNLEQDFEDFVALLNKHDVHYMIVGGYALAFHGKPRHTGDLDISIEISDDNAEKMRKVIDEFGIASSGMLKEDFLKKGIITQIGYPPLRIDILNEIDGVDFKDAYDHKSIIDIDGQIINYIGLDDLIKNKTVGGRSQDLTDVNALKKLNNGK